MNDRHGSAIRVLRREKLRSGWGAGEVRCAPGELPSNVCYLTGFTGDSSLLLVGRASERSDHLGWSVHDPARGKNVPGLEVRIRSPGEDMNPAVARVARVAWD